jgi:hypothetical protein
VALSEYSATASMEGTAAATAVVRPSFRAAALRFVLLGVLVYVGLYVLSEQWIYRSSLRNRFFVIHTAPLQQYDFVVLGSSHAAVFGYEDMNARLESLTGAHIVNLSMLGAGVDVNRLLVNDFLVEHSTRAVVYFIDSFVFYSPQWNEERLQDVQMFERAPFDPWLAGTLLSNSATRPIGLSYLLGFPKINNPDRFKPDVTEDEAVRFNRTYTPIPQLDRQRLDYLYPGRNEAVALRYLADFDQLVGDLESRGVRVILVKPPLREQWYRMLPNEGWFDDQLAPIVDAHHLEFHDFSLVNNDPSYFFNTDHLNRTGVLSFFENYLAPMLAARDASSPAHVP